MIGKSGQYYRAGYLCRMAGDWPDAQTIDPESSDSGQTDDQQQGGQPVKYDGSQNPNQSINVTAAPNPPIPLSDSPPLNATIGPETGSPMSATSASQQRSTRALAGSAYPGASGESLADTRSGMVSGAKPVQSTGLHSNRQQPSQGGANRLQGAAQAFAVDPQRGQMLNYIADCEGHAKHDGKGAERGWGAYDDSKNYCTTGYGQLLHQSLCTPDDYSKYRGETEAQARARLGQDYDKFYRDIHSRIPNANLGQTHSFVDQAFNMGVDDSTHQHGVINHQAWTDFNDGKYDAVPSDIMTLLAGGRGITPRREGEDVMYRRNEIPAGCHVPPPGYVPPPGFKPPVGVAPDGSLLPRDYSRKKK